VILFFEVKLATIPEALAIAIEHHQGGRLQAAEQIYRQILQMEPNHADALLLLGAIACAVGKLEIAVEYMARAVQLKPDFAEAHSNLGLALKEQGKLDEAVACHRRALALKPDFAEAHSNLGVALKEQGKLDEAVACYRRSLALKPDLAEAHNNLGIAFKDQGIVGEAVACYQRALRLKPDLAVAHNNLGNASRDQGNADEAAACCRRALALNSAYAEAHNNLGNALKDKGKLDEAVACYQRALQLKGDYAEAHNNLGIALKDQGKLDEAVACFCRAAHLKPAFPQAHYNLGIALKDQGKVNESVNCWHRALQLKPDYAEAHNNLGNALKEQGKLDEAVTCYRRALVLKPDYAEAHYNLGVTLSDQGKLAEAVACYRQALARQPDYAGAHNNLGVTLSDQGKLAEAAACYRQALARQPDYAEAHWNQSLLKLLTGNFERGWAEYEWRSKIKEQYFQQRHFSQPLWDGQPLAGSTILLHAEQGLGDTIQFIRYAALVKERVGTVLVECQPRLMDLLQGSAGIDQLVARGAALPPFGVQIPLLSLPAIFGTTLATVPAHFRYLRADSKRVARWGKELASLSGFRIGIAWQGDPKNTKDRQRSILLTQFESLAKIDDVCLVSLQKGPGAGQLLDLAGRFAVRDLGDRLDAEAAFIDTAAVMMSLDLIVTVDTAVAHLAGALGVPVWLALPLVPDWRWLLEREDSPWYPTMRLFRQRRPGDWSEVFERIAGASRALVATRTQYPDQDSNPERLVRSEE
jgi:tetratricopeptide (TPR) repeat protein